MMCLSEILKQMRWNVVPFTPALLDEWIAHLKIEVVERAMRRFEGFYGIHRDVPVIVINSNLKGAAILEVKTHEFIHCISGSPAGRFYTRGSLDKIEYHTERLTARALIPRHLIKTKTYWEIQDEFGYSDYLMRFRYTDYDSFRQ